jgi:hypothetical protein
MVCCPVIKESAHRASPLYYKTQANLYLLGSPLSSGLSKKQQREMMAVGEKTNPYFTLTQKKTEPILCWGLKTDALA